MSGGEDIFKEYKDLEGTFGRPISKEDLDSLATGEPFPFPKASGGSASASAAVAGGADQEKQGGETTETFQFGLEGVFDESPSRGRKRGSDVDLHPSQQTGKQWGDKKPRKSLSGGSGKGKGEGKGRLSRGNSKDYQKNRNQTLSNYITQLSELIHDFEEESPKGGEAGKKVKKAKVTKKRFRSKIDILRVSWRGDR